MGRQKYDIKKPLWLVNKTQCYFDGHGEDADGRTWYFITSSPVYSKLDPEKWYTDEVDENSTDEQIAEYCYNENNLYEQDGYHCVAYSFSTTPITWQQAQTIELTIQDYEDLYKLWQS